MLKLLRLRSCGLLTKCFLTIFNSATGGYTGDKDELWFAYKMFFDNI